jgi:hypothetical protein
MFSEDICVKAKKKLENKKLRKECLDNLICPDCGENLQTELRHRTFIDGFQKECGQFGVCKKCHTDYLLDKWLERTK